MPDAVSMLFPDCDGGLPMRNFLRLGHFMFPIISAPESPIRQSPNLSFLIHS